MTDTDWQQAIDAVLSAHLPDYQATTASHLWHTQYANGQAASVLTFVRDISARFELSTSQRHALRTAIYRAMVHGTAPAPAATPAAANSNGIPNPQAREVGAALVDAIRQQADTTRLAAEIAPAVGREPALAASADEVADWLAGRRTTMPALGEPAIAAAIHALYVAACRAFGPVAGDRLLTSAAEIAGALPAATGYPVSRLLYPKR